MLPILLNTSWLTLYSYPLFLGLGFGAGYNWLISSLTAKGLGRSVVPIFIGCLIGAWIGGKIFFLIYSSGDEMSVHARSLNFWLGGGLVFYGGLIGATLFVLLYSFILKKYPPSELHLLLPSVALGHGIGRIGCLMAGCCYGIPTDVPWALNLNGESVHPVPAYEFAGLMVLAWLLRRMVKHGRHVREVVATYALGYASLRFVLEFLRGDKIRGIHAFGLSTSQYISLGLAAVGLAVYLWRPKRLPS